MAAVVHLAGGHAEGAGDDRDMLLLGMAVGRHLVVGGELEPDDEGAFLGRAAEQHRDLGTGRQRRRARLNVTWSAGMAT
jgi:hypothetical protein